jgi:hypothetical protein
LAWLTAADEIPKVALHLFVRVPDDTRESGFRYESFLCRKDESMREESNGVCELCDRVGHEPTVKFVAMAVELEPTKEGKRTKAVKIAYDKRKNKDGEEVEYPRWGMVIQASKNFFAFLASYHENTGDIRDVAWEVIRDGDSTDTKYHITLPVELPDLSSLEVPSVEDILEGMGSDEKYAMVADIGAGSQPTFGGGSKPSKDSGTVPLGDRDTEFAKIREELGKSKVEAY